LPRSSMNEGMEKTCLKHVTPTRIGSIALYLPLTFFPQHLERVRLQNPPVSFGPLILIHSIHFTFTLLLSPPPLLSSSFPACILLARAFTVQHVESFQLSNFGRSPALQFPRILKRYKRTSSLPLSLSQSDSEVPERLPKAISLWSWQNFRYRRSKGSGMHFTISSPAHILIQWFRRGSICRMAYLSTRRRTVRYLV
jgi:hypothetical protein